MMTPRHFELRQGVIQIDVTPDGIEVFVFPDKAVEDGAPSAHCRVRRSSPAHISMTAIRAALTATMITLGRVVGVPPPKPPATCGACEHYGQLAIESDESDEDVGRVYHCEPGALAMSKLEPIQQCIDEGWWKPLRKD